MSLALYILSWAWNMFCVLTQRKSKAATAVTFVLFGLLFCGSSGLVGDAVLYRTFLETSDSWVHFNEVGFTTFVGIFRFFGIINYNIFLLVLYLISMFFMSKGISKYIDNYHLVFFVSFAYLVPFFCSTIRFFLATAIVLYALCDFNIRRKMIKYILLVLLATLFHTIAIFSIIYLLCNVNGKSRMQIKHYNDKKMFFTLIGVFVIAFCCAIIINDNKIPLAEQIINILNSAFPSLSVKLETYLTTKTNWGFVLVYLLYFINLLTARFNAKYIKKYIRVYSNNQIAFSEMTYLINMISIVILPLGNLAVVFFRMLVLPSLLNTVVSSCVIYNTKKLPLRERGRYWWVKNMFLAFLNMLIWLAYQLAGIASNTIVGVLVDNIFFK